MVYVIRPSDRESFKRCRRAWDLGARARQNYQPIRPEPMFDFDRAIHDALAVYYYPGMWKWDRAIVAPLAMEGFSKSMRKQRDHYTAAHRLSPKQEREWDEDLASGEDMLKHYFEWAPTADRFSPIRVESEFDVSIPDPRDTGRDLAVRGEAIRYRGWIDLLVTDQQDAYWLMDHRIVQEAWTSIERMLLDEQSISYCWAWEKDFLGIRIGGVIYNELRGDHASRAAPGGSAFKGEDVIATTKAVQNGELTLKDGDAFFRRTQVARSRSALENQSRQLAFEALDMTNAEMHPYPNPSKHNCESCVYREPCIAMNEGSDATLILESCYRKRAEENFRRGRIGGGTWSVDRGAAPPRFDRDAPPCQ
ncbi:MAG: PD-(D/E)XK nuclease family protein [Gammaproteobacteria bacterium]